MKSFNRIWNGPYPLGVYLLVVSLGTAAITTGAVFFEGWLLYKEMDFIPGATHISETFFTGLLATLITGIILHWHATRKGKCLTLFRHGRCPFIGLLVLGLALGGIALGFVFLFQGSADISYAVLIRTKVIHGFLTGLAIVPGFFILGLIKHPDIQSHEGQTIPTQTYEKTGTVSRYLLNLCIGTAIANMALFPGIAWIFYHSKEMINGAVVGTEVFFGGLICTLIVGITGHWEAGRKDGGCFTCQVRGNCPFLGIFIMGICLGVVCVTASHFYLENNDVAFKTLMWVKVFQGIFLGIAIPIVLVKFKLLLHPEVDHSVKCPLSTLAPDAK